MGRRWARRRRRRDTAIGIVALVVMTGALALLGFLLVTGRVLIDPDAGPTAGLSHAEGLVATIEPDRLVVVPSGGGTDLHLVIDAAARDAVDLAHLRVHEREMVPVRVYYETRDGARRLRVKRDVAEPH